MFSFINRADMSEGEADDEVADKDFILGPADEEDDSEEEFKERYRRRGSRGQQKKKSPRSSRVCRKRAVSDDPKAGPSQSKRRGRGGPVGTRSMKGSTKKNSRPESSQAKNQRGRAPGHKSANSKNRNDEGDEAQGSSGGLSHTKGNIISLLSFGYAKSHDFITSYANIPWEAGNMDHAEEYVHLLYKDYLEASGEFYLFIHLFFCFAAFLFIKEIQYA